MSHWDRNKIILAIQTWVATHGETPRAAEWQRSARTHPNVQIVSATFGTWNEAISAAGFDGRRGRMPGASQPRGPELRRRSMIAQAHDLAEELDVLGIEDVSYLTVLDALASARLALSDAPGAAEAYVEAVMCEASQL